MPSNHLILCHPLPLLPSVFPSIRVFASKSAVHIRWPKCWSFSFSIRPSSEYSGLISFRMGFPCRSDGKEFACNVGDPSLIPGLGRSTGEGIDYALPIFLGLHGDSAGKESKSNAGDLGLITGLGRSPGEGNSYPLQYSGLKNSMDYPWGGKELDLTEQLSLL